MTHLSTYWVIEERQGETWQPALKRPIAHEPLAQRCIQRLRDRSRDPLRYRLREVQQEPAEPS